MWQTLLLNRWVQLGAAVIITALIVGPWQRYQGYSHEHKERLKEVAELNDIITKGAIKAFKLSEASTRSFQEAEDRLQKTNKQLKQTELSLKQRIKENEELRSIILPPIAVELFNSSTNSSTREESTRVQDKTNTSNDAKASSTGTNLAVMLEVATRNNLNHLACVAQVQELQSFVCNLFDADGQPLNEFETCVKKEQYAKDSS